MLYDNFRRVDPIMIGTVVALSIYGCVAILAASHGKSIAVLGTSHIVEKQMVWDIVGLIVMTLIANFDYRILRKWSRWVYGIGILSLLTVYGFAPVNGSRSWIHFSSFTMEPSEFVKLGLIVSVAAYMAKVDDLGEIHGKSLRHTLLIFGMLTLPWALTFKEPNLGQSLVMLVTVLTMYVVFIKRLPFIILSLLFPTVVGAIAYMVLSMPKEATSGIQYLVTHHVLKSYQVSRIVTWINPNYDLTGTGYEIHQTQLAVGSGGLFGEGLFGGILTNDPAGVPNQTTDYIFTAIAEEFGFIGSVILIMLFLVLIQRIVRAASLSQDTFGTYVLSGVLGMIGFQVFENIGMNMYLSPSTGITLPFISYGGTSVVANYIAIGLALGVLVRSKKRQYGIAKREPVSYGGIEL